MHVEERIIYTNNTEKKKNVLDSNRSRIKYIRFCAKYFLNQNLCDEFIVPFE